ncbi:host attachment protein [Candidatus Paracaedibacter symbiosus]|uniref:host attachment protein n=1 Tax=Candidatus Paracaedibacter symbiosus TaxID=244582 RepID=UPI0005099F6D|nr:host attachment protein [Candidatus Paracaedibacter symbiosus]
MIWVIVCDGSIAKVFQKQHRFSDLMHLESFTHSHESTHEHGKDKPGRDFESGTPARHAYEPKHDWHEYQKEVFIQQVSTYLLKALKEKRFSKIYFICPPKIIGVFRDAFGNSIDMHHKQKLTITEIHKDLTHSASPEIDNIILKEEGWK